MIPTYLECDDIHTYIDILSLSDTDEDTYYDNHSTVPCSITNTSLIQLTQEDLDHVLGDIVPHTSQDILSSALILNNIITHMDTCLDTMSDHSYSLIPSQQKKQKKNTNLGPHTQCINCGTNNTSVWRRSNDQLGSPICNACGLYEKMHHTRRPLGMRKESVVHRRKKAEGQRRTRINKYDKK